MRGSLRRLIILGHLVCSIQAQNNLQSKVLEVLHREERVVGVVLEVAELNLNCVLGFLKIRATLLRYGAVGLAILANSLCVFWSSGLY